MTDLQEDKITVLHQEAELHQEDETTVPHSSSYFEQAIEFKALLARLINNDSNREVLVWSREELEWIRRLFEILDSYQEQSHLLDPHLEQLIVPMVEHLRVLIQADPSSQQQYVASSPSSTTTHLHVCFRYLYYVTKTRGYKTVVKFFTHEVSDLEPTFYFLLAQDPKNHNVWQTRYMCFIWLSLICMIPFDLRTIDSQAEQDGEIPIVRRMIDLCKSYLSSTGKERDGASILVARLLTRRDIAAIHLTEYLTWATEQVRSDINVFMLNGILSSLCTICQFGPREMLLPTLDTLVFPVLQLPLTETYASYAVIRKLFVKLAQRVGLCYLKPKIASWRYQRGNRSLKQNLEGTTGSGMVDTNNVSKTIGGEEEEEEEDDVPEQIEEIIEILLNGLRDKDTIVRWSSAKGLGRITQRLSRELADDVIDSLFELFSENILPTPGSDEPDLSAVSDNTYHGACLAVAELTRRGLLLPVRLAQVVPWCVRALRFDQKRGAHSVGAHVRDAACYVCWSFARAYAPEVVAPHVERISINLVIVSVFDREVNVRRASSAAFQENVGRQGIFPHGIDIIQAADYFSVGNRVNAFLKVSVQIAKYEEYRYHLIDQLCMSIANHWDKTMRILGAKTLNALSHLDPRYMIEHVLPMMIPPTTSSDMNTSHGALMAVGEICMGLYACRDSDTDGYWVTRYHETVQSISAIISHIPPSMLTTFGSEHICEAACHFITCLSQSNWPVDMNDTLTSWKAVIHTSLERREENVQEHAVGSFGAVTRQYGVSGDEIRQCVATVEPSRNVSKFTRRGYALALGTVDYKVIPEWLDFVVEGLSRAAAVNEDNLINNAEVKRNAVLSLIQIVEKLGFDFKTVTPKTTFLKIISTLLTGLDDYSVDQRGDIGSWVREASMRGLGLLVPLVAKLDLLVTPEDAYLSQATCLDVVAGLLKQSVERIDRTRSCAGSVLHDVFYATRNAEESQGKPEWLIEIPGRSVLEEVMPRYENLNWSSPADVYPRMVRVLVVPEYRFDLLIGLVSSAGGLTESLVRYSSACLIDYVSSLPVTAAGATDSEPYPLSLTDIIQTIVSMFTPFYKQDRVTIPLLEVTGLLFESGTLNNIKDEAIFLKMLELVKKEALNTRDIRKLIATIRLLSGFAGLTGTKARVRALQQLLIYLVHPFPRIRVAAADQLYLYLSTLDDEVMDDGTTQAEEIVMATKWISPVEELKPIRNSLYPLLSIPPPVLRPPVRKQA